LIEAGVDCFNSNTVVILFTRVDCTGSAASYHSCSAAAQDDTFISGPWI